MAGARAAVAAANRPAKTDRSFSRGRVDLCGPVDAASSTTGHAGCGACSVDAAAPHDVVGKALAEDKMAKSTKGAAERKGTKGQERGDEKKQDNARLQKEVAKLKAKTGKEQSVDKAADTEPADDEEDEVAKYETEVEYFKKAPAWFDPSLLQQAEENLRKAREKKREVMPEHRQLQKSAALSAKAKGR